MFTDSKKIQNQQRKKWGALAEAHAVKYLQQKGYTLLEKNYRYQRAEIDIIVQKENILVFVEVKARKNNHFGNPEQFVNKKKQALLLSASVQYMIEKKWQQDIRFDIIAILNPQQMHILHLEDAFY